MTYYFHLGDNKKNINGLFNYINNNGILIIYYDNYNNFQDKINILKTKFRSIEFYKVLNSVNTYY